MSDIQVIIEVLGQKDMEKAARVTQTLENKVRSLSNQFNKGRINYSQYIKGVNQLTSKNKVAAGSYRNLQSDVMKYASSLVRVEEDIKDATRAQQSFNASQQLGGNQMARYNNAAQKTAQTFKRRFNTGMQQAGFQVGDLAVQLQSGTNAAVALGQQGSQLLGIWGPAGALAGAGLAIGTAFIAPLIDAQEEAENATESISNLESALRDYTKFSDRARMSTLELKKEFGDAALEIKRLSGFLKEVAVSRALDALSTQAAPLSSHLDRVNDLLSQVEVISSNVFPSTVMTKRSTADFQELNTELDSTLEKLQMSREGARNLREALSAVEKAKSLEGIEDSAINALNVIKSMGFESGKIPPEVSDIVDELERVIAATARATNSAENLRDVSSQIDFSNATRSAKRLAEQLGISLELATRLDPLARQQRAKTTPVGSTGTGIGGTTSIGLDIPDSGDDTSVATGGAGVQKGGVSALAKFLMTEQEKVDVWREQALEKLRSFNERELELLGGHEEAKKRLQEEYRKKSEAIALEERSVRLKEFGSMFGALADLAETGGRKLLKVQATLSAAATMIAAYEAAAKAAAEAKTIPGRIAAWAMFVAKGVAAVKQIQSIGNSGRVSGGGSGGGGAAAGTAQQAPARPQRVIIEGLDKDSFISGEQLQKIFDKIYEENEDRGFVFQVST